MSRADEIAQQMGERLGRWSPSVLGDAATQQHLRMELHWFARRLAELEAENAELRAELQTLKQKQIHPFILPGAMPNEVQFTPFSSPPTYNTLMDAAKRIDRLERALVQLGHWTKWHTYNEKFPDADNSLGEIARDLAAAGEEGR